MPDRAIAYIRCSTSRQDLSPDAQRAAIEEWAKRESVDVAAWHEDLGISGGAELEKRPGLLAATEALRTQGAGVLVVAKRDRLARDVLVSALVERLCERQGARIVSADGAGNGDGPEAALMRSVIDAFAAYERALIRSRTKAALAVKKAKGERVGGWAGSRTGCGSRPMENTWRSISRSERPSCARGNYAEREHRFAGLVAPSVQKDAARAGEDPGTSKLSRESSADDLG